jgi:hypothetical protein
MDRSASGAPWGTLVTPETPIPGYAGDRRGHRYPVASPKCMRYDEIPQFLE